MIRKSLFLAFLAGVFALSTGLPVETQVRADFPPDCDLVCSCQTRTTATFTRVGANCTRAQNRAAAAASAAAVCNAGETPCGSTTVYVTHSCFPHPVSGQTAASAFAEYKCEVCYLDCGPICPPIP